MTTFTTTREDFQKKYSLPFISDADNADVLTMALNHIHSGKTNQAVEMLQDLKDIIRNEER